MPSQVQFRPRSMVRGQELLWGNRGRHKSPTFAGLRYPRSNKATTSGMARGSPSRSGQLENRAFGDEGRNVPGDMTAANSPNGIHYTWNRAQRKGTEHRIDGTIP